MFGGAAVQLSTKLPLVLLLDAPSQDDVKAVVLAIKRVKAQEVSLLVRPAPEGNLRKIMAKIMGEPARPDVEQRPSSPDDLYAAVLDSLRRGELPMPAVPTAVVRIRDSVQAGETSSEAIAEVVELDPSMTTMVLRLAGSATYKGTRRVRNVREAIMRIGALQVARLAETLLARRCFAAANPKVKSLMEQAWVHTLARALIMRFAARFDGPDQQERQYLQALLADVGNAFLVNATLKFIKLDKDEVFDDRMMNFLASNHELIGATLLESWRAPSECAELARVHHARVDTDEIPRRLHWATCAAVGLGYPTPFERAVAVTLEDAGRELSILDPHDAERLRRDVGAHLIDVGVSPARAA